MGAGGFAQGSTYRTETEVGAGMNPGRAEGSDPPEMGISECICICLAKPRGFTAKAKCSPLTYLMSMAIPVAQIGKLRLGWGRGDACPGHGGRKGQSHSLNLGRCSYPHSGDFLTTTESSVF